MSFFFKFKKLLILSKIFFLFRIIYIAKKNFRQTAADGKLVEIRYLWEQINNFQLNSKINDNYFFKTQFCNKLKIKQYFTQKVLRKNILSWFIHSNKKLKIFYPMPLEIRKIFVANGIAVNHFISSILWFFFLILNYFISFFFLFNLIFNFFKYLKLNFKKKNYSFYISTTNFDGTTNEFKNWLKNYYQIDNYKLLLTEEEFIFSNINKFKFLKFVFWYIKSFLFMSIRFIFFFDWYYLLLFRELVYAAVVKFSNQNTKSLHFFYWTDNIYRPLWTYESEKKGNETIMTYGGLVVDLKVKNIHLNPDHRGFKISTWNNHSVVDETMISFLKTNMTIPFIAKIQLPFSCFNVNKTIKLPEKSVAVFAYEDNRYVMGCSAFIDYQYSNGFYRESSRLLYDFYWNLLNLFKKKNYYLVTKRKKNTSKILCRSAASLFTNLSKEKNFILLDSAINPVDIIISCKGCISMPVTSTSVIAKFKNKPSIFYDPYNWIDRKDISLANNLVLDIEEVEKWLDTIKI